MTTTAVILIGGPNKGTRFRPLSFKQPKFLFPLGQHETIYYHILACSNFSKNNPAAKLKNIYIIGSYQSSDNQIQSFLNNCRQDSKLQNLSIQYLQEYANLGTAGAIYHFRDVFSSSEKIFVFNGDVLCNFPMDDMWNDCKKCDQVTNYGTSIMCCLPSSSKKSTLGNCIIEKCSKSKNIEMNRIIHFVEKPKDLLPTHISTGIYLLDLANFLKIAKQKSLQLSLESHDEFTNDDYDPNFGFTSSQKSKIITLEKDIFPNLVDDESLFMTQLENSSEINWVQIKTATSALNANRFILQNHPIYEKNQVYIHPTAEISDSAKIGPNVSIGAYCKVGPGVRITESIILPNSKIGKNSCVVNSIIGWNNNIGDWAHIEGILPKVNPNLQNEILENKRNGTADSLNLNRVDSHFEMDGTLKKLVTILGHDVTILDEMLVYSCLILPGKTIDYGVRNQIVL